MIEITLIEQIKYLLEKIVSSPLIIFVQFLLILMISLSLAYRKKKNKKIKYLFIALSIISTLILIIKYNKPFLQLTDGFIESLIMYIYFPNLVIYISIVLLSNVLCLLFIKSNIFIRIASLINAIVIDTILMVFLNEVGKKTIDIYQEITVNSQKDLLINLQLTTETFAVYVTTLLFIFVVSKLYSLRNGLTREIIDINTLEEDFK